MAIICAKVNKLYMFDAYTNEMPSSIPGLVAQQNLFTKCSFSDSYVSVNCISQPSEHNKSTHPTCNLLHESLIEYILRQVQRIKLIIFLLLNLNIFKLLNSRSHLGCFVC